MKIGGKEKIDPELATQLKETRETKNLTQAQVAKLAKVTETFYAMTERGEANPSIAKLNRILGALGLKLIAKNENS